MLYQLALLTIACTYITTGGSVHTDISIAIGEHYRLSLTPGPNYTFSIQPPQTTKYSAFVLQLHTQQASISLYNASANCHSTVECVTKGTSVGMVQLLNNETNKAHMFRASFGCAGADCSSNVSALIALVGVEANHPIPGGCAKTSNLENDAELSSVLAHRAKKLYFQDSGIGFDPAKTSIAPLCDYGPGVIKRMEYHVYRTCLSGYDFSSASFFDAIERMLYPATMNSKFQALLKGGDIKKVIFDSIPSAGEVYSVIVYDTEFNTYSSYIPVVAYGCELGLNGSQSCELTIPVLHMILGPIIGLVGLFLCFLAQRCFHLEVYVFPSLILSYLFFILLNGVTDWTHTVLLAGSIGLGAVAGLLLYSVWFFLGWYYMYVLLFGLASDFIVTATILFTPLGTMFSVLAINYVYALVIVCGCGLFVVVLVAFPRVLNIFSSSLTGSYAVVFSVGMFKRTSLTRIILRVVDNATVAGFLSSPSSCQFELLDIVLSAVWGLLFILGVIIQSLLAVHHKRAYKKREASALTYSSNTVHVPKPYRPFPVSPFKQIKMYKRKRSDYSPLLSQTNSQRLYGTVD